MKQSSSEANFSVVLVAPYAYRLAATLDRGRWANQDPLSVSPHLLLQHSSRPVFLAELALGTLGSVCLKDFDTLHEGVLQYSHNASSLSTGDSNGIMSK